MQPGEERLIRDELAVRARLRARGGADARYVTELDAEALDYPRMSAASRLHRAAVAWIRAGEAERGPSCCGT
jgi:hypothetical protein